MSNYVYLSATEIADSIRRGEVSSTAVVKDHIEHIRKHNPKLNAFVLLLEEEALEQAAVCDQETLAGISRGALHGVPISIKEQFWMSGTKTTVNSNIFEDWTAPEDALVVKALREAGAIILGKTNVAKELSDFQVSGDIYPDGKNPYQLDYSPGGSGGGSSAALASGMAPIDLGVDFGGSIRNPASFCGLYGLKPTDGAVSCHGIFPKLEDYRGHVTHMMQPGPMARCPEDLELVWHTIRGPLKGDRDVPRIHWSGQESKRLQDYSIAWIDRWPDFDTSENTKSVIHDVVSRLTELRCRTTHFESEGDLHSRSLSVFFRLFGQIVSQNVPFFIKPLQKHGIKKGLLKGVKKFHSDLNTGFSDSFLGYSETMGLRAGITDEWETIFESFDLLICPVSYGPAYKRCRKGDPLEYQGQQLSYLNYAFPFLACFNASGHPAIHIPCGLNSEGLPIGVQVVGPLWSEDRLIHFAKLLAGEVDGYVRPDGF
ncbi:amidase [Pseudomaricurvus alkylphenolicus]|uniref:amidase n=1 Tax=Pseudomaricurvus alkylphenolicus TaxID=1306991 RepID=UPI0014214677|nr:amidase [Pseudomaricurvus alkylphenolicus]NIB40687.1 amidase [Pseudomaricurvus alkylphenolicus]